ncbi:MAG: peptidyl-prolyl cis-trans isomerase [Treponema sp.]|nr:peptidyl-prolyl cis-trans isomerase [Treponema sp.]
MKKTLLYVGSVFILILSAITFIFIPAMLQRAPKGLVFGKYDGKKIEWTQGSDFANAVANYSDMYKNQGVQLDDSAYFYIYNYAFNSTVTSMAYADAVKKSGYEPSTATVSRAMVPYFADENGNYSARLYNATAESTRNDLRKNIRKNLIWNRYSEDVFGSSAKIGKSKLFGLKTSDAETNFLAGLNAKKRSFDLVSWNKTTYPDEEVIKYGVDHYELFNKHDISVISLDDKAETEKLLAQITNNEVTFEDAIKEYSKKYYSGDDGKLTSNYEYQIKEIIPGEDDFKAVIDLEKDGLSPVIQTANNSYSIFRRNEKRELNHLNVEENIDVVRNYLNSHEAGLAEEYNTKIAKDFAASAVANGFDKACKEAKVEKVAVPAFTLNYGGTSMTGDIPSDIKELQGANRNENFLEKAFSLKNGEVSEPIIVGNNVIVLKLTGEQTDSVTDEAKTKIAENITNFDSSTAQKALLNSPKVENNVSNVFFNEIMASKNS